MRRRSSPSKLYSQWLAQFTGEAQADDGRELQKHIDYLRLDCSRADFLLGTSLLVAAGMAYLAMDGLDCTNFVRHQRYRLGGEGMAHYVLTFGIGGKHYGRLLSDKTISDVDFADLFEHPWEPFETAGYTDVYISRLDGGAISGAEYAELERRVTEDIHHDYTDDEVSATLQRTNLDDSVLAIVVETIPD